MNCREFESLLEDYLERRLSRHEADDLRLHALRCPNCASLQELSTLSEELDDDELVRSVLQVTSGDDCRAFGENLCGLADEEISVEDREFLESHLEHCSRCMSLLAVLSELNNELPKMAELEPDAYFTRDVILKTAAHHAPSLWASFRQFLLSLWVRPRFSWEAAYVGALLLFAVAGVLPTGVVDRLPTASLAGLHGDLTEIARSKSKSFTTDLIRASQVAYTETERQLEHLSKGIYLTYSQYEARVKEESLSFSNQLRFLSDHVMRFSLAAADFVRGGFKDSESEKRNPAEEANPES